MRYGTAYLFVLPAFLLYALFMIYPFAVDPLHLHRMERGDPVKNWVGLDNYQDRSRRSLWLAQAQPDLGDRRDRLADGDRHAPRDAALDPTLGFTAFRTVYFLPQVLSSVVISLVWGWIYNPIFGILNEALDRIGLESISRGWLGDQTWALYAVLIAAIWAETGFVFVVFLAGLQNVSKDLLEAATLDGANAWRRFWNVVVPQMSNVINIVTALLLIGGFAVFDIIIVMTDGGPNHATEVIATYTYDQAFTQNKVGYGAALSLVMTAISLVASVLFIRLRERGERSEPWCSQPHWSLAPRSGSRGARTTTSTRPDRRPAHPVPVLVFVFLVFFVPFIWIWSSRAQDLDRDRARSRLRSRTTFHWENLKKAWTIGHFDRYMGTVPSIARRS